MSAVTFHVNLKNAAPFPEAAAEQRVARDSAPCRCVQQEAEWKTTLVAHEYVNFQKAPDDVTEGKQAPPLEGAPLTMKLQTPKS